MSEAKISPLFSRLYRNTTARILTPPRRREPVAPVLVPSHWLPAWGPLAGTYCLSELLRSASSFESLLKTHFSRLTLLILDFSFHTFHCLPTYCFSSLCNTLCNFALISALLLHYYHDVTWSFKGINDFLDTLSPVSGWTGRRADMAAVHHKTNVPGGPSPPAAPPTPRPVSG